MGRKKLAESVGITRDELEGKPLVYLSKFEPFHDMDMRDMIDDGQFLYMLDGYSGGDIGRRFEKSPEYIVAVRSEVVAVMDWYVMAMAKLTGKPESDYLLLKGQFLEMIDFMADTVKRNSKDLDLGTTGVVVGDSPGIVYQKVKGYLDRVGSVVAKLVQVNYIKTMVITKVSGIIGQWEEHVRNDDSRLYEEYYGMKESEWDRIEEGLRKERARIAGEYEKTKVVREGRDGRDE